MKKCHKNSCPISRRASGRTRDCCGHMPTTLTISGVDSLDGHEVNLLVKEIRMHINDIGLFAEANFNLIADEVVADFDFRPSREEEDEDEEEE